MQSTSFQRGPDRRTIACPKDKERRQRIRRNSGINWIPLFRDTEAHEANAALADCEVILLTTGAPLLKLGETNHNVYILLSGKLNAHLNAHSDDDAAIPILPGECIGELSAIDGKPATASILACGDARVLKLSRAVFWNRLMALPGVASNLMLTLTQRMRRINEQALKSQRLQLELLHIRKELDIARQLQTSMLPLQRPLFPERQDIEVCGFMEPASEVGGDLFDAFFVDAQRLFFCIGDVSGHGIGAALFMARTISLMRVLAVNTPQPDTLLETLNERLCSDNDANIFVTLFCGFLNVDNGKLTYSNGGHCAPILSINGRAELLAIPKGALIGAIPGINYSAMERYLDPGDMLFCYTDGVTEAQSPLGEEFSEARCMQLLDRGGTLPLATLLDNIRREVSDFSCSNTLDDDCTMLALRRTPAMSG